MTFESFIFLAVFLLWLLTTIHGAASLLGGVRFYRYVARKVAEARAIRSASGGFAYQPKAAVILPCCGMDEKLEETVQAIGRQNYTDYEVVFTFESEEDPAYAAVGTWVDRWDTPSCRRVVAGLAERRSQKIHNLLAAIGALSDDREVLVFLDSDAVPDADWLGHLVAPLQDAGVGASTGYRWYVASGGLAAGVRCAWNASTMTLLEDERRSFTWGGATAMRRDMFESLGVARAWDRALSDDLQVTRVIREAGLRICFVPQAMVLSSDRTTLGAFWSFARRQTLITRVCAPEIWRAGLLLCLNFVAGGMATGGLCIAALLGWIGNRTVMLAALSGWLVIILLGMGKALARQLALRKVLSAPELSWRDVWWDVFGTVTFSVPLHLHLFASSMTSRRIVWRNTEYELVSADETRILRREAPRR